MNYQELTEKINAEMSKIEKDMKKVLDRTKSKAEFVKYMYNQYKIICL